VAGRWSTLRQNASEPGVSEVVAGFCFALQSAHFRLDLLLKPCHAQRVGVGVFYDSALHSSGKLTHVSMATEGVAIRMMSERRCADSARLNLGHAFVVLAAILAAFSMLSLTGCTAGGSGALATPAGAIVGRSGYWNYSPSVIQTGDVQQFWWCGTGKNPSDSGQISDSILYESINTQTQQRTGPFVVLAETPGRWDALYTCNPRVIRGTFANPLGDGQTYSYEMFYVGTVNDSGNAIGAAFSNDGIQWTKYPDPVIVPGPTTSYGVGQPAFNYPHPARRGGSRDGYQ
jgi:hypothetical protein